MRSRLTALLALSLGLSALHAADDDKLKPVNLPINTDKDEDDPFPSTTNLTLLYTSNASGKKEVFASQRKKTADAWPAGKAIPELTSKRADFAGGFLTADGKYPQFLYFATNADPENLDKKGDNYDLYFLIKQTAKSDWTTLSALVTTGSERDELHPWLAADGQTLYFSRLDKDGWRVYATTRPPEGGQFGPPTKLDLPPGFHHATVSADGKTMYLQGPLEEKDGKPRWGLFRSTLTGKTWGKPEPLTALNSADAPTGDRSPALSRDGATLYFASDRPGGKGGLDVWSIPTAQLNKKK